MKFQNKILLSLFASITLLATGIKANETDKEKQHFYDALDEIKEMLEGEQVASFERAVFLTENAYWGNKLSYKGFQQTLDFHANLIETLIKSNKHLIDGEYKNPDFDSFLDHKVKHIDLTKMTFSGDRAKAYSEDLLKNWAIYSYLTDTLTVKVGEYEFQHLPYEYPMDDPFGLNNWSYSQVTNLLTSQDRKGNCYAQTALFKVLSERLNTDAQIAVAPQHVFIQHKDKRGDIYNIELVSRAFPDDGTLQTLTYTTKVALMSGISMRALNLKESVTLSLIYLAKGYEQKFGNKADDFLLLCANLALKHDPLNLSAMLLKSQVYETTLYEYAQVNSINDWKSLQSNANTSEVFYKQEATLKQMHKLGYIEMPAYMHNQIYAGANHKEGDSKILVQDLTPKPYGEEKAQDARYFTITHGLMEEVHVKRPIEKYGLCSFDTKAKTISDFNLEPNETSVLVDPVVFAMSVDPLAHKFPAESPYLFSGANPIFYIDKSGLYKISAADQSKSEMFTSYLKKQIKDDVLKSENIMNGLMKYGQLNQEDISRLLTFGKGPTIEIVDKLPFNAEGYYTGGQDGVIQISQKLIDNLNSSNPEDKEAALLWLSSTLLHETVHFGDWQDGNPDDNQGVTYDLTDVDGEKVQIFKGSEKGQLFESEVYKNSEFGAGIDNMQDAKNVVNEKSQTTERSKDLPNSPQK